MSIQFRSNSPRASTYPKYPNTSPLAPTVSVPPLWNSHTASPLVTITMSVTARNLATPR